jgi:hypothetical protein
MAGCKAGHFFYREAVKNHKEQLYGVEEFGNYQVRVVRSLYGHQHRPALAGADTLYSQAGLIPRPSGAFQTRKTLVAWGIKPA